MSTTELFYEISDMIFQLEIGLGAMQRADYVSHILISIYCFIIIKNQRKIKKMLREMQENRKEDDGSI